MKFDIVSINLGKCIVSFLTPSYYLNDGSFSILAKSWHQIGIVLRQLHSSTQAFTILGLHHSNYIRYNLLSKTSKHVQFYLVKYSRDNGFFSGSRNKTLLVNKDF